MIGPPVTPADRRRIKSGTKSVFHPVIAEFARQLARTSAREYHRDAEKVGGDVIDEPTLEVGEDR